MKKVFVSAIFLLSCLASLNVSGAAEPAACAFARGAEQLCSNGIPVKPVYDFGPHDNPDERQGLVGAVIHTEGGEMRLSHMHIMASYVNTMPVVSPQPLQQSELSGMMNSLLAVSDCVDPINRGCLLLQKTLKSLTHNKEVEGLPQAISFDYGCQERVIAGGALMYAIRDGAEINALDLEDEQPMYLNALKNDMQAYLHGIVDLTFYMYAEAINKGQPFIDGSFIVLDKDLKLWNFLMYYCRLQNAALTGTKSDKQVACSLNDLAYCRQSSHLNYAQQEKDTKQNRRHYGIDLRAVSGAPVEHCTATGMPHILFGLVGKTRGTDIPVLFIKLEDAGIALSWDWFCHAFGFVGSKGRKAQAGYAPGSAMREILKGLFGADDGCGKQKERTSLYFQDSCKHLFAYSQCPLWEAGTRAPVIKKDGLEPVCGSTQRKKDLDALKNKGMKELARLIDDKPSHWTSALHKACVEFYEKDCEQYDYPTVRTGDEVIIGSAEFESCPFYACMLKALHEKTSLHKRNALTDMAWVCEQMYENEHKIRHCEQGIANVDTSLDRMLKEGYEYLQVGDIVEQKATLLDEYEVQHKGLLARRGQLQEILAQRIAFLNSLK